MEERSTKSKELTTNKPETKDTELEGIDEEIAPRANTKETEQLYKDYFSKKDIR